MPLTLMALWRSMYRSGNVTAITLILASQIGCADVERITGLNIGQSTASPTTTTPEPATVRPAVSQRNRATTLYRQSLRYLEGNGVPVDLVRAADLAGQAADLGSPDAQYLIGINPDLRAALQRAPEPAVVWLTKAALQGHGRAQYRLAQAWETGDGVSRDLAWAALWFNRAAERGIADAEFSFALLQARGEGTARNESDAYGWFVRAAAAGHPVAGRHQVAMAGRLDAATRRLAERRIRLQRRSGPVTYPDRPLIRFAQSALAALGQFSEPVTGQDNRSTRGALLGFARSESLDTRDPFAPTLIGRLRERSHAVLNGASMSRAE